MIRHQVTVSQHFDRMLHDNVLVRRYTRPATYGSILLPDSYQTDKTMTLWEVVLASAEANQWAAECGFGELRDGDILVTWRKWPIDTGLDDEEGRALFVLSLSKNEVQSVQRWNKP